MAHLEKCTFCPKTKRYASIYFIIEYIPAELSCYYFILNWKKEPTEHFLSKYIFGFEITYNFLTISLQDNMIYSIDTFPYSNLNI